MNSWAYQDCKYRSLFPVISLQFLQKRRYNMVYRHLNSIVSNNHFYMAEFADTSTAGKLKRILSLQSRSTCILQCGRCFPSMLPRGCLNWQRVGASQKWFQGRVWRVKIEEGRGKEREKIPFSPRPPPCSPLLRFLISFKMAAAINVSLSFQLKKSELCRLANPVLWLGPSCLARDFPR